eukprot:7978143-Lingulodinium_polyedra.AAC.1
MLSSQTRRCLANEEQRISQDIPVPEEDDPLMGQPEDGRDSRHGPRGPPNVCDVARQGSISEAGHANPTSS